MFAKWKVFYLIYWLFIAPRLSVDLLLFIFHVFFTFFLFSFTSLRFSTFLIETSWFIVAKMLIAFSFTKSWCKLHVVGFQIVEFELFCGIYLHVRNRYWVLTIFIYKFFSFILFFVCLWYCFLQCDWFIIC